MYSSRSPETIKGMFNDIASRYDIGNTLLSLGMHRGWKKKLVRAVSAATTSRQPVWLDLCAGTGDVAFHYLASKTTPSTAYLLDFCPNMLEVARRKATHPALQRHQISFIEGDALDVPLEAASVDAVTIAYGIRNVQDPHLCVAESYRVLRPGGCFAILEHSLPTGAAMHALHRLYLKTVVPTLGRLLTSNAAAYAYLSSSIESFQSPPELEKILQRVGFADTRRHPLSGGISTIVMGTKR